MLLIPVALIILGITLLLRGGAWLVDGASSLARRFNVPEIAIGLTIVAVGTSAPELVVNIAAAMSGDTGIAIGNIVGSNIANIFLILGLSAAVFPLVVRHHTVWKEIPLSFLAALTLTVLASDAYFSPGTDSVLSRGDGIIFLSFFSIFVAYVFSLITSERENIGVPESMQRGTLSIWALLISGVAVLAAGGKMVVLGAVDLATLWGVEQTVIGLTIVAVGTSLPELVTSLIAAVKKNPDLAVGNIVGSNIVNVFFILGISALIRPLPFSGVGPADISMLLASSAFLFAWMFVGSRFVLDRWQGAALVLAYFGYLAVLGF